MKKYSVRFKSSAEKELNRLSESSVERVFPRIEALSDNPRPAGCKKLRGGDMEWRIRVGVLRVVYTIDDDRADVEIVRIQHRRDVYE